MGMIIQTISMKSVTAEGLGTLSVFEGGHDVPFDIKRIYYISVSYTHLTLPTIA